MGDSKTTFISESVWEYGLSAENKADTERNSRAEK